MSLLSMRKVCSLVSLVLVLSFSLPHIALGHAGLPVALFSDTVDVDRPTISSRSENSLHRADRPFPLRPSIAVTTAEAFDEDQDSDGEGVFDSEQFDLAEEFEDEFSEPAQEEVFDPLSGYNRLMTQVNDRFYFWILKPAAVGYRAVVPSVARTSVQRLFHNLFFPVRFVNNAFQLKFKGAGVELARFVLNSTVGIGGLADPAKAWFDLDPYPEDFGQTLGFYGIAGGFHLVLPILGPSNLRDTIGLVPDFLLDPICYVGSCLLGYWDISLGIRSYHVVNQTSLQIGEYESLKRDAFDLYLFLRDAYEKKREKEIGE